MKLLLNDLEGPLTTSYRPIQVSKYGLDGYLRIQNEKERRLRVQAVRRLQERELFEVRKNGERYEVALTRKGIFEACRLKVWEADLCPPGRESIIMFDIPESQRKLRDRLRRFLRDLGYFPLQRSVWVSEFNAGQEIQELFAAAGAKGWVRSYLAKEQVFQK